MRRRILTTVGLGIAGSLLYFALYPRGAAEQYLTDFDPLYGAAKVLLAGGDPYAAVGPGAAAVRFPFPLYFPLPALLLVAPLTALPMVLAGAIFVGCSTAALTWALSDESAGAPFRDRVFLYLSLAFLSAVFSGQWSMALTAGALMPRAFGVSFAAKPTLGAAMWLYRGDWRAVIAPAALTLLSLVVMPDWPARWLGALRGGYHPVAAFVPGGALVLFALRRWRRGEARMLAGLSLVPQTFIAHGCLPLFLCARTTRENAVLAALVTIVTAIGGALTRGLTPSYDAGGGTFIRAQMAVMAPLIVWGVYIPCAWMVTRRSDT